MCTHQFTPPAVRALVKPVRQQERRHQRRDEQADDASTRRKWSCPAQPGRTNDAANEQNDRSPAATADGDSVNTRYASNHRSG